MKNYLIQFELRSLKVIKTIHENIKQSMTIPAISFKVKCYNLVKGNINDNHMDQCPLDIFMNHLKEN